MPGTEPTSKLLECVCEFVGRGEGGGGSREGDETGVEERENGRKSL